MSFLVENLVASVKRRSLAPIGQSTFQDSDIIALLWEELIGSLVPDILSVREDFFLKHKIVPIIASVTDYPIPERAIGNALKDVLLVDSSGSKYPLSRLQARVATMEQSETNEPNGFYMLGDEVSLNRAPSSSEGSLDMLYFSRPSELVPTSECSAIESVASLAGTTTFTVDTDLSATIGIGDKVDFQNTQSPFLLWAEDVTVTAITNGTIAVATADVSDAAGNVQPGALDYVTPARKSNIAQVPLEFHPVLVQMTVCRLLEGLGDLPKLTAANGKLGEMRRQAFTLVANRVESATRPIVNRFGIGSFSGGR